MAVEMRSQNRVFPEQSEIPPGLELRHVLRGHDGWINRIAWSPDGQILASASNDNTIRFWNAESGQAITTLVGHGDAVVGVAWSPDGRILASSSADTTVRLWDVQTGSPSRPPLERHTNWVFGVAWSPDG